MNLGVICDLAVNKSVGIICVDSETGTIGYTVEQIELENVIEIILDNDLELIIKEQINGKEILRKEKVNCKDKNYLTAFNYYLPYPWRILGVRYIEGNIDDVLKDGFQYMEGI